jgi:DNA replication protein DnaC
MAHENDLKRPDMNSLLARANEGREKARALAAHQAAEAQAQEKVNQPEPTPSKSTEEQRAEAKEEKRDLFYRRAARLREVLPWIPQDLKGFTLKSYQAAKGSDQERAVGVCRRFVDRFLDRVVDKCAEPGILLVGVPGTGKTHLAKGILAGFAYYRMPGFFLPSIEFFDLFTPEFSSDLSVPHSKLRELLAGVSCLVIDDVGAEAWTSARRVRLKQIIDMRTDAGLPTIITSNMTPQEAQEDAGERLSSRFSGSLYTIVCAWEDWRKKCSLQNRDPMEIF